MAKKSSSKKMQEFAQEYGFQYAFLHSDPELFGVFKKAVAENYDPAKFKLEVQKTKWYRNHADSYRQALALKTQNPGEYKQQIFSLSKQIADKAGAMGVTFNQKQLNNLAQHWLAGNWTDAELNNVMSRYITFTNAKGQARSNIQVMQQLAWKNGLRLNGDTYRGWAQRMASGNASIDDFTQYVRGQAAGLAPAYADQIKGGMNLYDVAQPYMNSMAQILEMNPADIDVFTPEIRQALSSKDAKTGKPASVPIYAFEQQLRGSSAWLKTQNAQDSTMAVGHKVLQDFGLIGN